MSGTYGAALGWLIAAAVFFGAIGFLLNGKMIRGLCWLLSVFFVLLIMGTAINHRWHNNNEAKDSVGIYEIDTNVSRYAGKRVNEFRGLTLTVKDDYTFLVNKQTPFFEQQTGHWSFEDDGDLIFIDFWFGQSGRKMQLDDGIGQWTFLSYQLKNGVSGDKIVFRNTDTLWQQKLHH